VDHPETLAGEHMTKKGMRKLGRAIAENLARNAPRRLSKEASKAHHSGTARMENVPGWKPGFLVPPVRR
jgi:hypothetical protein